MGAEALRHARYASGEILGAGAQGVVLRVTDREAPELSLVAKVFRGGLFEEGALAGEFSLLARLRVPGLVRAHDLGRDEGTGAPFLVEAFVDGDDARKFVEGAPAEGRSARVAVLLAGVARALSGLHAAGFVHGDLKPAHVRVSREDAAVTLLDLGCAVGRARTESAVALTREFASPELLAGEPPSPASDLYALGALLVFAATGEVLRNDGPSARVRRMAPWLRPTIAELLEALVAPHPRDRPAAALDVLGRIGAARRAEHIFLGDPPAPIGREAELEALLGGRAAVMYVTGPSGTGKSHLARELVTRSLLAGRAARLVSFPEGAAWAPRLLPFFRGLRDAWPFASSRRVRDPLLLVLDDLDRASPELAASLDAFRCRIGTDEGPLRVVATSRSAPTGAHTVALGPLDPASLEELCRSVGVSDMARARAESAGNPGFLLASAGRVPLTAGTALERTKAMSEPALAALAALAMAAGTLRASTLQRLAASSGDAGRSALGELSREGLVARRNDGDDLYVLRAPAIAKELASALGSFDIADRTADALLADTSASAASLLAVAGAETPPARRNDLLVRAATKARSDGLRSEETDALLSLAADPARRSPALLRRLERVARDGGTQAHPMVLAWLAEAAERDPRMRVLSMRRHAERDARSGAVAEADDLAERAHALAKTLDDPAEEALALSTRGLVALYRADWTKAEAVLGEARSMLTRAEATDAEEVARLFHNLGVVALYRGNTEEAIDAFERAIAAKRRLGDRAGTRSCLLNLGLALARAKRFGEAERALDEAIELARSLEQAAGLGWCLSARADVAVRRERPAEAERWIGEARAMADALPAAIRADLGLLTAEVRVLEGNGRGALSALENVAADMREADPLIDGRARVLEARAHLALVPANRRKAARLAVGAARTARKGRLGELEAQALDVLRRARADAPETRNEAYPPENVMASDESLWTFVAELAVSGTRDDAATRLSRTIAERARAERVFVVEVDARGAPRAAWGTDVDGLPIGEALQRLSAELVEQALGNAPDAVYHREAETVGGTGSRLALAAPKGARARAVVVVEHRFRAGHFDTLTPAETSRWAALAALVLRLDAPPETSSGPPVEDGPRPAEPFTTAIPLRKPRRTFVELIGKSPLFDRALAKLDAAIDTDLPALVRGETGVGKELFARALHDHGRRRSKPFVAINCGAVPDSLFEAELFGHARGSFTGADRARPGLVARAEGGTLFLDEIGELPPLRQAGLLRALESRRYRPVGSDEERPFDVRIVAATNRDLERAVADGTFRQDLLFRINAVSIHIPPLRERASDVALLARAFLDREGSSATLSETAVAALSAYDWPGNVRELWHAMQRLSAAGAERIDLEHLPRPIRGALRAGASAPPSGPKAMADAERVEVERALAATAGNISRAAERLGLTRHGLKKRMVRLGLRAPATREEG